MAARYWVVVLLTGLGAGVAGGLLTLLLHAIQDAAFGYTENTFLFGVQHAAPWRRVVVMTIGGLVAGVGWYVLRRWVGDTPSVTAAVREGRPLPTLLALADAVLQIVIVALGASLGREGAPRQAGAALASQLVEWVGLNDQQRRLLIASGAGAGLAAVYNVPLGGAVFTLEVVLGSWERRAILPALITSVLATTTAWAITGNHPTYDVAHWTLSVDLLIFSIVIGPLSGLAAIAFVRLMAFARASKPSGWRLIPSTTIVFAAVGVLAIAYPHLLGNGKGPAQQAFDGHGSVLFLASLVLLKPLATAACLRSGAVGGVFTPALATGALFGAATGTAWLHLWPGAALGAFALAGAAGLLSGTLRAPFSAIVLMLELTHAAPEMIAPVVLAVAGATLTFRGVNYGSIYRPHPRERPVTR